MTHRTPRRTLVASVGLATLLAVAACGPGDDAADASGNDESPSTRNVEHVLGTADIPADPQRVFVASSSDLDSVLALGIEPVGSAGVYFSDELPDHLLEQVPDNFPTTGQPHDMEFEEIALLEPDVVVGLDDHIEPYQGVYEDIAPTIAYAWVDPETGLIDWRDRIARIGELFGLEETAQQVIADGDAYIEELDAQIPDNEETVALIRSYGGQIRYYSTASELSSGVLQQVRSVELVDPTIGEETDYEWTIVSPEVLTDIDADWVYLVGDTESDLRFAEDLQLWDRIPAVQNDKLCVAQDFPAWFLGGPTGSRIVADEVEACFSG